MSLRSLKIRYLKRYVGGLVHSMDQPLHIALLGLWFDDGVSASLFDGLSATFVASSTSNGEKRLYHSVSDAGRCAEVRRQGYDRKIIST